MNIVHFSGGKDSTAMLLMLLDKGIKVDQIVFCDLGKEFPALYRHIEKVEKYIQRSVVQLSPDQSFDYYFSEHLKLKGKNAGKKGYGWATSKVRWCTGLKIRLANSYLRQWKCKHTEYVGISFDERKRCKRKQYPLVDWKITGEEALSYCLKKGFNWENLYQDFVRVSCWCCPLKRIGELKSLYFKYPDLWNSLLEMDKKTAYPFKSKYSVDALDKRFYWKQCQIPLFPS